MFGKKKNFLLIACLIVSLLCSSCGIFGGSESSNKKDSQHVSIETESQGTESIEDESQAIDSSEIDSTEMDSIEENSTEADSTEDAENETNSQDSDSDDNKNANSDNKENNISDSQAPESSENQTGNTNQTPSGSGNTLTDEEQLAKEIVDQIISPGMSDFQKVLAIHDWLTFNIDYDYSYSNYDVASTLKTRKAVCQGYALTFEMMAEMAGLEAAFIGGTANNGSGYQSHAWNRVKVNGTWYNLDATWDDPSEPGKSPSDHSGNRYDYFLISDSQINQDHSASSIPSDCGSCSSTYDRLTVYRAAVNSGRHGNVALVTTAEELNAAIEKYMNKECTTFWVWYYNTSVTADSMWNDINALLSICSYPASSTLAYPPENGLTKYQISITPMSSWNAISVVTDGATFEALHNSNLTNGITQYTVRYESVDGVLNFGLTGGFSYSYSTIYKSGTAYLLTVTVQ